MARVPEATYRAALQAIVAFDRRAALAAIAVPTLCLAGEHDRTAPPEVMQRMAERIAGAEYHLPGGGGPHRQRRAAGGVQRCALLSFLRAALRRSLRSHARREPLAHRRQPAAADGRSSAN